MKFPRLYITSVWIFTCFCFVFGQIFDTSHELANRHKRSLIFLEGINWVQFIAGIGLPMEIKEQSVTLGTVIKAFYLLPTNSSYFTHPTIEYARRKRTSSAYSTRWIIYRLIERLLERNGFGDGKACLLRCICDAASTPFDSKTGVLAEIIHAVLTPSTTTEDLTDRSNIDYHAAEKLGKRGNGKCQQFFPECYVDFMEKFTRFLYLSGGSNSIG